MPSLGKFGIARDVLVEKAQAARKEIVASIESGERDWQKQRELLVRYQQFVGAADLLYQADGKEHADG